MSLLITSNTPKNDVGQVVTGLNLPYTYQNNLQDTFKIPAMSKIAVQSVKINKSGNIAINRNNLIFGFFFGEIKDPVVQRDILSFVVPSAITDKQGNSNYAANVTELASNIERAGRRALFHPNLLLSDQNLNSFRCLVNLNASDLDFLGFKMLLQSSKQSDNASNISKTWIPVRVQDAGTGTPNADYNSATGQITNNTTSTNEYIGTEFPLSLAGGSFEVTLDSKTDAQIIGLTRCQRGTSFLGGAVDFINPTWFQPSSLFPFMYDYAVIIASGGDISVYHSISDGQNLLSMVEIPITPINAVTAGVTGIVFIAKGEQIRIELIKSSGPNTVIIKGDSATATDNAKPISMNTRFLFPKVRLLPTKTIKIKDFYGVNIDGFVYGDVRQDPHKPFGSRINSFHDWWSYKVNTGGVMSDNNVYEIDVDYYKMINFVGQKGLNVNGQVDYEPAIVTAPDASYQYTRGLNSGRTLGFFRRPFALRTRIMVGSLSIYEFISDETPDIKSTESFFVRLKNMTFNSINMAKSAQSKILYHIPAFSNFGTSTGALFFEPNEMVYLDLNNPHDIYINTIEVEIVKSDETLAKSLVGKTIICFHIKSKDGCNC